jgi:hypothetical protein
MGETEENDKLHAMKMISMCSSSKSAKGIDVKP